MKKTFVLMVVCCIAGFISCKKDNHNNKSNKVSIVGSWHLFDIIYSLTDHVPSDSIVLSFDTSGNYNETTNDSITAKGSYSLNFQQIDSLNQTFIIYNPALHDASGAEAIRSNDTLVLIPDILSTDGYGLKYKKL